jgi:steroid 5-alpha reductase family enzyme
MVLIALAAILVFVLFTLTWIVSLMRTDASLADWVWAPGFGVVALVALSSTWVPGPWQLAFFAVFGLWCLRLSVHMVARAVGKGVEDPRYADMRARHGAGFGFKSLIIVFWLQAVLLLLVATPLHAIILAPQGVAHPWFATLGLALAKLGLVLEALADRQLQLFRADPLNKGQVLQSGLWAWSRHPNYFGESLAWAGFGVAAFGLTGSIWALAGPVLLVGLILKVSGVPLMEAHLAARPGFADYAARTSLFIPWPPKARPMSPQTSSARTEVRAGASQG